MADSLPVSSLRRRMSLRINNDQKLNKTRLISAFANHCSQKSLECINSVKRNVAATVGAGDAGTYLLTTVVLELVRRFSSAKCPFIWRGLQALQLLHYPPFKWIQNWTPLTVLVKKLQTLSRPLFLLSVATGFSGQLTSTEGTLNGDNDPTASSALQAEPFSESSPHKERCIDKVPRSLVFEKKLLELYRELDMQGISIPKRLDADELRRFYDVSNGDFSRFLESVKNTIHWRKKFTLLSPQELKDWRNLIFWHGSDVMQRPCLIVRLGIACSDLRLTDKSLVTRAVVSQIEYGIENLIDVEHPQLTVLMDCMGLSPFGFPLKILRSCALLLQDHYPNRLGCLLVIRLPPVVRVITRTLFQVLKPNTRQKIVITGEDYQQVLLRYLETLPQFLGGTCSCSKCLGEGSQLVNTESVSMQPSSDIAEEGMKTETTSVLPTIDTTDNLAHLNAPSPVHSDNRSGTRVDICEGHVRNAVMEALTLWVFISFILGLCYHRMIRQYDISGS